MPQERAAVGVREPGAGHARPGVQRHVRQGLRRHTRQQARHTLHI